MLSKIIPAGRDYWRENGKIAQVKNKSLEGYVKDLTVVIHGSGQCFNPSIPHFTCNQIKKKLFLKVQHCNILGQDIGILKIQCTGYFSIILLTSNESSNNTNILWKSMKMQRYSLKP